MADKMCYCPYCFLNFDPNYAMFKAESYFTLQDDILDEEDERILYLEHEDKQYNEFWKKYPGSIREENKYEKRASLTRVRMNINMAGMTLEQKHQYPVPINDNMLVRDSEDFIYQVRDTLGEDTRVRICPRCHNILPHEFGKYPVKYIAVVGITSSGKTVYLSQLLKNIDEYMTRMNLTVIGLHREIDNFVRRYPIRRGQALPSGTTTDALTTPMVINVKHNLTEARHTLVFFDIAGENCVDEKQMEKYGMFVTHADSIIMIVDPGQMVDITGLHQNSNEIVKPQQVANAMQVCFINANSVGGKTEVPLAATISKSDLLEGVLSENSHVFKSIDYSKYGGQRGFASKPAKLIHMEISNMITRGNSMAGQGFKDTLESSFANYAFFAVSALNCIIGENEDKVHVLKSEPDPLRIEEPLAWVLHKMGIISEMKEPETKGGGVGWPWKK